MLSSLLVILPTHHLLINLFLRLMRSFIMLPNLIMITHCKIRHHSYRRISLAHIHYLKQFVSTTNASIMYPLMKFMVIYHFVKTYQAMVKVLAKSSPQNHHTGHQALIHQQRQGLICLSVPGYVHLGSKQQFLIPLITMGHTNTLKSSFLVK